MICDYAAPPAPNTNPETQLLDSQLSLFPSFPYLQHDRNVTGVHPGHPEAVAVCASTGVAAVHVNGCTFHSFLGCGLGGLKDWEKVKFQKSKREAAPGSGG